MVWRLGLFWFGSFCLLSSTLSTLCVFCTEAQLLDLVFPSLPVFASGGWGVSECGITSASRWSIPVDLEVPHPASRQWSVECVWEVYGKCFFFFSFCVCEHIFILA